MNDPLDARAMEIGDAALDLDAGANRDAYVEISCGPDDHLKRLVRSYLSRADSSSPFFDQPLVPDELPADSRVGQMIGRWKLLSILGEGGFGVVYLAERTDGQVRQVGAVKFLRGTVRNRDLELRFRDERQILANLNCPYIVGLIDAGVTTEGQPYLVMQFVENARPIDSYCRQEACSIRDC